MLKRTLLILPLAVFAVVLTSCDSLTSTPAAKPAQEVKPAPAAKPAKKAAYKSPALTNPQSWTMVVVPDVQFYIKMRRNHGIVDLMNTWIAENAEKLKIQQLLFV